MQEVKATLAASQVTVAPKMDHWESLSTIESIFRPFDNSADDNYFVSDESVLDKWSLGSNLSGLDLLSSARRF